MATDLELFLERAGDTRLRPPDVRADQRRTGAPETVDALFHLTAACARNNDHCAQGVVPDGEPRATRRGPPRRALRRAAEVGIRDGDVTDAAPSLRQRTGILEIVGLIAVSRDRRRTIELTQVGKESFDKARQETSDLGMLVRGLRIAQDRSAARLGTDDR